MHLDRAGKETKHLNWRKSSTMYKHDVNKGHAGGRNKNGDKLIGSVKVDVARECNGTGKPRDGRSAKLSREGTYDDEIQILWCKSVVVIRCNTIFCSGLLDFPP